MVPSRMLYLLSCLSLVLAIPWKQARVIYCTGGFVSAALGI
jgi:hypothetical protein